MDTLLEGFVIGYNDTLAYSDPPLIHESCGEVICTLEPEDTLAVLVSTANGHVCSEDSNVDE